jgi:CelD/BcsL family acetyltransferase involved in cellulose biosynthesis
MNVSAQTSAGFLAQPMPRSDAGAPRVELFDAYVAAEPVWRQLEQLQPLATPYQRFEWIRHWFDHVGRRDGADPLVVAGLDGDGTPLFVIPLMRELRYGCAVARFCGGTHTNLNMPIWRQDIAAKLTASQVVGLLADVAKARDIDLFKLLGQPLSWRGARNPFATLPRQPSPDDVYGGTFDPAGPAFEPRLPSGMRKKARKLAKLDSFRYFKAQTAADVEHVLGQFWPQKATRFARQGIHNVFADRGVRSFIEAACHDGLAAGRPVIELHGIEGCGEMLAIVGGVVNDDRFSVMFNSITDTERARLSPGILLMAEIVKGCAQRGLTSFDLGAGHAPYKDYFCAGYEQRFDSFIPFSARGRLVAAASQASDALRRSLKATPALMNVLHAMRRWTTGATGRSE